jgi:hypothetical protein
MAVNGFIPNKVDVSKYSFIMFFANISQNAAVQMLNKCGNSLISVTSRICTDISRMIIPSENERVPVNNQKERKNHENTSSDYAVVMPSVSSISKRIIMSDDESKSRYASFIAVDSLFKKYNAYKMCTGEAGVLILFLIFVIAIRQRKGWDSALMMINKISKKTRISA